MATGTIPIKNNTQGLRLTYGITTTLSEFINDNRNNSDLPFSMTKDGTGTWSDLPYGFQKREGMFLVYGTPLRLKTIFNDYGTGRTFQRRMYNGAWTDDWSSISGPWYEHVIIPSQSTYTAINTRKSAFAFIVMGWFRAIGPLMLGIVRENETMTVKNLMTGQDFVSPTYKVGNNTISRVVFGVDSSGYLTITNNNPDTMTEMELTIIAS